MKTITKCLVALATVLTIQAPLSAYVFSFENNTGEDLMLNVRVGTGSNQRQPVMKEMVVSFDFKGVNMGACLSSVKAFQFGYQGTQNDVTLRGSQLNFCNNQTFTLTKENGNYVANPK